MAGLGVGGSEGETNRVWIQRWAEAHRTISRATSAQVQTCRDMEVAEPFPPSVSTFRGGSRRVQTKYPSHSNYMVA